MEPNSWIAAVKLVLILLAFWFAVPEDELTQACLDRPDRCSPRKQVDPSGPSHKDDRQTTLFGGSEVPTSVNLYGD